MMGFEHHCRLMWKLMQERHRHGDIAFELDLLHGEVCSDHSDESDPLEVDF